MQRRVNAPLCYLAHMIRLYVREYAEDHGITSAYQLKKAMGISTSEAQRLWKGEMKMIALKTLNLLCETFACGPEAFFDYAPDKKKDRQ